MTQLESFLGAPLDAVKFAELQRLVTNAVPEGEQLDFKREPYAKGEDLGADVVALANSSGGAIIIGIEEKEGVATAVTSVQLSDETTLKMRQWLASYTTPHIELKIRAVPSDDAQRGAYIVNVPRSSRDPHAVVKNEALRYYRRSGPRNRVLSESEVADAYYARFSRLREQEGRLDEVLTTAVSDTYARAGEQPWMVVILAPTHGGAMDITASRLRALERWADDLCLPLQRGSVQRGARAFPSIGRVFVTTREKENDPARSYLLELYTDGAGAAAVELIDDPIAGPGALFGNDLVKMTAGCLRIVAEHAFSNAGARGTALVRCRMTFSGGKPLRLGQDLRGSWWEPYYSSRALGNPPVGQPRAIDIDAVLADPVEWMSATRLVLTDVMHDFGLPEVLHINEDGSLNTRWWPPLLLDAWKAVAAVPKIDREVKLAP